MTKKKNHGGGKSITRTAFKWIRIGALAAPALKHLLNPAMPPDQKINEIVSDYTGWNGIEGMWRWEYLVRGWSPYFAAILTTYGIPKIAAIIRKL